jgi:hypothetical protein
LLDGSTNSDAGVEALSNDVHRRLAGPDLATVNRGRWRASFARICLSAISNTTRGASIRNSPVTSPRSAVNPSTVLTISVSASSTPAMNRFPASVRETLRVVRANNGIASRSSTLRKGSYQAQPQQPRRTGGEQHKQRSADGSVDPGPFMHYIAYRMRFKPSSRSHAPHSFSRMARLTIALRSRRRQPLSARRRMAMQKP